MRSKARGASIQAAAFRSRSLARRGSETAGPSMPVPRGFLRTVRMGRAYLVQHVRIDVRAMDRGVAAGRPARPALQEIRVWHLADHEFARLDIRPLHLHMA